jgi:hypothetical protein
MKDIPWQGSTEKYTSRLTLFLIPIRSLTGMTRNTSLPVGTKGDPAIEEHHSSCIFSTTKFQ